MPKILVLTTDLPYFPGKNGHDFFNLRHIAETHDLGVVAPCYEWFPPEGVANLEAFLAGRYFWPRPVGGIPMLIQEDANGCLPRWMEKMPAGLRKWMLNRLLGIQKEPADAYQKLAILANCAPYLLKALSDGPWQTVVLIQTSAAPWLDYLPRVGGKLIYFHDVRSDYLAQAVPLPGQAQLTRHELAAIKSQEARICREADAVGFVSDLDLQRARHLFDLKAEPGVAPIPVDTAYYTPAPAGWQPPERPVVLFTGHLTHPPNVDAVLHFLADIWPLIKAQVPQAVFCVAGMQPATVLVEALQAAADCELHANVPDIRPFFWNARAYVVPMRFGGGVRQKIFEAWSMQVPVVSTVMAVEGTGAESGVHAWLEDDTMGFAHRVAQLLKGETPNDARMIVAAKQRVEAHNSIPAAASRFKALAERTAHVKRAKPFRILFDLRWMELGKAGGVEQATHELVAAISRLDHRNYYRLHCPRSAYYEWDFPRSFRIQPYFSDPVEAKLEGKHALLVNRLAETVGLQPVLNPAMRSLSAYRKLDFDLVHSVCSYTHPDLRAFPGILTVNDIQHVHHPQFFSTAEGREREKLYRESVAHARHIICISEYTRQDLHRHYQVPLEKMTTIWLIPSRHVWAPPSGPTMQRLLTGMGVQGPFLYFPAHDWPHKNHARLVEAFALIQPHIPKNLQLIFSGRPFNADHPARALIRQHQLEDRVRHLGYRSPIEVQALLYGCFALVFPSLFEGFGIPVMDAIIAGKPIACSNCTSLPEIAGDAALTFDPLNIHDIGRRLLEVINDPARRAALIEAGRNRRPLFSSRDCAAKTLSIYQRVHDELYRA